VPKVGIEPTLPGGNRILSRARDVTIHAAASRFRFTMRDKTSGREVTVHVEAAHRAGDMLTEGNATDAVMKYFIEEEHPPRIVMNTGGESVIPA
jgi:hypothetical protein